LSVRLPHDLAAAARAAAGGEDRLAAWLRDIIRRAATTRSATFAGAGRDVERSEGWKAGWTAANKQFRTALAEVIAADMPEPS
jgi:hypothetical protein